MFRLHDFCVPITHGLLNVFPFYTHMGWFYLSTFYSIVMLLHFYPITNFDSHYHHYDCFHYHCYYYFCHCHRHYYFFIFNACNFYQSQFSSFYFISLYILNIFKFESYDMAKHYMMQYISVFDVNFEQRLFNFIQSSDNLLLK